MDIELTEGGDVPRAPSDVRFRRVTAEAYADRQRVKLTYELSPFLQRPNVEILLEGPPGTVLGSVTIIETIDSCFSLTVHLRADPPSEGRFDVISTLGYEGLPEVDRVKPAASHVPSGTVDKAGLELSGPADGGIVVLQYDRAYQASEGE